MSDPNILNLLSEETYIEKMDTLNEIMEGILIAQGVRILQAVARQTSL